MGLFKSIFNKRKIGEKGLSEKNIPTLMMVFNQLPIMNYRLISEKIQDIEVLNSKVEVTPDDPEDSSKKDEALLAVIKFDNHKIKLIANEGRISDDILNCTVNCTSIDDLEKEYIINHNAYMLLKYEGTCTNASEVYIALYKVTYAFINEELKGVLNIDAWNCQIPEVINGIMSRDSLVKARRSPLISIWTNYLHLSVQYGTWIFTKGYNVFGLKDLAYLGEPYEADKINSLFEYIFKSAINNEIELILNESIKLEDGMLIRFKELESEKDLLEGPNGTLQIEILNKVR